MSITQNLNSLSLSFSSNPEIFIAGAHEFDGKCSFILDMVAERSDRIFVYFSHFVNLNILGEHCKFFGDHGKELHAKFETFARGIRAEITNPEHFDTINISLNGEKFPLQSSFADKGKFADKNSAILIINGESAKQIAQWAKYHQMIHHLEAMLIIIRQDPNAPTSNLAREIETALPPEMIVEIFETDAPLGKDEPSAREIYMAPDAPGKERMDVPAGNPWRSDLHDNMLLEIMRLRYLSLARAVLHIHPSDILSPSEVNIFDFTLAQKDGYTQLLGQRCYPWRIRKSEMATFGDHCAIMFENPTGNKAWCVNPNGKRKKDIWNLFRVGAVGEDPANIRHYWRMMAMRHDDPSDNNPTLAPKTALVLSDELLELVTEHFGGNPVLPPSKPDDSVIAKTSHEGRRLIVTTMKNEGPFLLEWLAYHRAIGFDDFVVYTNDCTDGTDHFFDLLHKKGIVEHRQNPYVELDMKPQHAALADVQKSKLFKTADWIICMDVDEYVNIHVGDGTLDDLFAAVPDANMISLTWRLVGNSDVVEFIDRPIIEQFNRAAHDMTRFPHQAWGVKTLYRQLGYYKKMGVHRPKGLKPEHIDDINWVNGSGKRLPQTFYRTAWRTGTATVGYDMVTLNHYAVRSMKSFLVKRDRGRVNHVDRDQGLQYWFRMNHNVIRDNSIKKHIPKMQTELDALMADPEIAQYHHACVEAHQTKIDELLTTQAYQDFFALINSERLRELSRYTNKYGMNVFEIGPDVITEPAIKALREEKLGYYNVNADGKPFE